MSENPLPLPRTATASLTGTRIALVPGEPVAESELPNNAIDIICDSFGRMQETLQARGLSYYDEHCFPSSYFKCCEVIDSLAADIVMRNGVSSMLDIGIGDGRRIAKIINQARRDVARYGVDLNKSMLRAAVRSGAMSVLADITRSIPFASGSFNFVTLLSGNLGYVITPGRTQGAKLRAQVLRETYDLLSPGGTLFLDMNAYKRLDAKTDGLVDTYTRKLVVNTSKGKNLEPLGTFFLKTFTPCEICSLLEEAGLPTGDELSLYLVIRLFEGSDARAGTIGVRAKGMRAFLDSLFEFNRDDSRYRIVAAAKKTDHSKK